MRPKINQVLVRIGAIIFWLIFIAFFVYSPTLFRAVVPSKEILSIITWADYIDEESIKEFERQTGVKVYINFYENNDELLSKLELTKEKSYDLAIPTDYALPRLIERGLLRKIDKSKLDFYQDLDPNLLGKYFDPKNEYSLPYFWDVLGVGYNKKWFDKQPPASWGLLFNKNETPGRVGLTDDPREVLSIAALYLFGTVENLTDDQLHQVEKLLLEQKEWVESYSDLRGEFLLYSGTCPAAMIPSFQVWQGVKSGFYSNLEFLLPEKTFMIIDNLVIPKGSSGSYALYKFINFLYRKGVIGKSANTMGFFPPRKDLLHERKADHIKGLYDRSGKINFKKFMFMKNSIDRNALNSIWLKVKSY